MQGDDVDPIKEIAPEAVPRHFALQILVGRRDNPDVDLDDLVAADAPQLLALQEPQQLDLHLLAHLADLVQEDRAPVGHLEQALVLLDRPGEGALLVPVKLALQERLGYRAAVDLDEGLARPGAPGVDLPGDHLFPRAALSLDQHGGIGGRDPRGDVEDPLHRLVGADDFLRFGRRGVREGLVRLLRVRPGLGQPSGQLVDPEHVPGPRAHEEPHLLRARRAQRHDRGHRPPRLHQHAEETQRLGFRLRAQDDPRRALHVKGLEELTRRLDGAQIRPLRPAQRLLQGRVGPAPAQERVGEFGGLHGRRSSLPATTPRRAPTSRSPDPAPRWAPPACCSAPARRARSTARNPGARRR